MNQRLLQSALRDLHLFAGSWRLWITFIVVVLLFTLIAPFDTGRFAPLARFGFWLAIQGTAWFFAVTLAIVANVVLPAVVRPEFVRLAIGSSLACPLIGASIVLIRWGAIGTPIRLESWLEHSLGAIPLSLLFCLLAYAAAGQQRHAAGNATGKRSDAVIIGDAGPSGVIDDDPRADAPIPLEPPAELSARPATAPRLLARLKPANRAPLLRMAVEDHYTRVVTRHGTELLLMRFGDAVAESGGHGLQVHRSHWVAFDNLGRLVRDGGRLVLETRDGTRIPVSRTHAAALRQHLRENANKA